MSDYSGNGVIYIEGCADVTFVKRFTTKFGVGSSVYIKAKALKGVLENIVIKKVNKIAGYSENYPFFNYVDTTNGVWLENELVWQSEALADAILFYELKVADERELACLSAAPIQRNVC